jgi:predicted TIM-barrel enzyme
MLFTELFKNGKPLIACVHLMPLPGSPRYSGSMREVYDTALSEIEIFMRYRIDGLIIENFRDKPFYPNRIPAETISALAALTREAVKTFNGPVGVNALRNDAQAAVAIATATEAHFIRVNIHMKHPCKDYTQAYLRK